MNMSARLHWIQITCSLIAKEFSLLIIKRNIDYQVILIFKFLAFAWFWYFKYRLMIIWVVTTSPPALCIQKCMLCPIWSMAYLLFYTTSFHLFWTRLYLSSCTVGVRISVRLWSQTVEPPNLSLNFSSSWILFKQSLSSLYLLYGLIWTDWCSLGFDALSWLFL